MSMTPEQVFAEAERRAAGNVARARHERWWVDYTLTGEPSPLDSDERREACGSCPWNIGGRCAASRCTRAPASLHVTIETIATDPKRGCPEGRH